MRLDLLGNPSSGGNCYVLAGNDETIMLDAGLAWSPERNLGVDFTVPHLTEEQAASVSTIVITHPHEDHIGALSFILAQLKKHPRIIAGPITAAIVRARLDESRISVPVESVPPFGYAQTEEFQFRMIPVPHSSSESMALHIRHNDKTLFYSGDLRGSDETGYGKLPSKVLAEHAPVDFLLLEAVRADVDEPDPTLAELKEGLLTALRKLSGRRIIVSAFASNFTRIQVLIELAQSLDRHVYLLGRSMHNAVEMAQEFKRMPKESWALGPPPKDMADSKVLILVAGAQGEPDAGLSRLIRGHYPVQARRGDGLIMSSTPIPGNEDAFWSLVELAMTKGVEVITYRDHLVHLSGHSTSVELQRIMRILKPRRIIPFHGDYYRHAVMKQLGLAAGLRSDAFIAASNGDSIWLEDEPRTQRREWPVDAYQLGKGKNRSAIHLSDEVLTERRRLQQSGAIVIKKVGRRSTLECIDCPAEVAAWIASNKGTERRSRDALERQLARTFVAPPAVIELG